MKKEKLAIFLIIAVLFFMVSCGLLGKNGFSGFTVNSQSGNNVLPSWARKYSTSSTDHLNFILPLSDGGYILNGFFDTQNQGADGFAVKIDPNGQIVWQKSYGGQESDVLEFSLPTSDGGFIFFGHTNSFDVNDGIISIKVNSQGDVQWAKIYDTPGDASVNSVVGLPDGILIAGSTGKPFLAKISYEGELIFGKVFTHESEPSTAISEFLCAVKVNENGQDYYILGGSGKYHPNEFGRGDGLVVKFKASDDQIVWAKTVRKTPIYDNYASSDNVRFIVPVDDGYVLLGKTGYQGYLLSFMKISLDGEVVWAKNFGEFDPKNFISTENGFLILADKEDGIYTIKTQSNGQLQEISLYSTSEGNSAKCAFLNYSPFGGFIFGVNFFSGMAGNINNNILSNFVSGPQDFVVIKTDQNGILDSGIIIQQNIYNYNPEDYTPLIEDLDLQIQDINITVHDINNLSVGSPNFQVDLLNPHQ